MDVEYRNMAGIQGCIEEEKGSVVYLQTRKMVYLGFDPLVLQCHTVTMHMRLLNW
jgi:hypothetical protein